MNNYISLFLVGSIFCGFSTPKQEMKSNQTSLQEPSKQAFLVFVDVTRSISDTTSFNLMLNKFWNVFRGLKENSRVAVYPLHARTDLGTEPIFYGTIPEDEYGRPNFLQHYLQEIFMSGTRELKALYARGRSNPKNRVYSQTCILFTLPLIEEFFLGIRSTEFEKRVFYFSDMLEDCHLTNIDMDFPISEKKITQYVDEKITQSASFDGITVHCILPGSTEGSGMPEWLHNQKLAEIWTRVFDKFGIKNKPKRIHISTLAPDVSIK